MRTSRAIRASAWALTAVGVAAPLMRRRVRLPRAGVMTAAAVAPAALAVAMPRSRSRDLALLSLNMWAYLAAYELPHDEPEALAARAKVDYPIAADRIIGLGKPPTLRLQHGLSVPGEINRFERVLVWCHWAWFAVPHATVLFVRLRRPEQFEAAAARMYAVFDLGAACYWVIPTAPPWWAARQGRFDADGTPALRRMMIEYGERFWGERWPALYDVLGGNPLAAMPSLHFATSLMSARLLTEAGPVAGTVGWSYALLLGLALVYLGEHYAADLLGGAVLAEGVRRTAPRAAPLARRFTSLLVALERRAAGR